MTRKSFFWGCIVLCLSTLIMSCSSSDENADSLRVLEIDAVETECNSIFDLVEKIKMIPLESNDNALISVLFKILYQDDRFYLLDPFTGKTVLIYNADGSHIKTISTLGKGPGEFTQPWDIGIDDKHDELIVTDAMAKKVLRYDLYGEFIDEVHVDFIPVSIGFIDSVSYAFRTQIERAIIVSTNRAGQEKQTIHENYYESLMPNFYNFQNYSGDLLYYEIYNDTIYKLRQDTALPWLYLDFLENKLEGKSKKKLESDPGPERLRIKKFLETKGHTYLSFRQLNGISAFFYNKKTKEKILIKSRGKSEDPLCKLLFNIMDFTPETGYYTYLSALDFMDIMNQPDFSELVAEGKIEFESDAYQGQGNIDENSNPVLILMKFK